MRKTAVQGQRLRTKGVEKEVGRGPQGERDPNLARPCGLKTCGRGGARRQGQRAEPVSSLQPRPIVSGEAKTENQEDPVLVELFVKQKQPAIWSLV